MDSGNSKAVTLPLKFGPLAICQHPSPCIAGTWFLFVRYFHVWSIIHIYLWCCLALITKPLDAWTLLPHFRQSTVILNIALKIGFMDHDFLESANKQILFVLILMLALLMVGIFFMQYLISFTKNMLILTISTINIRAYKRNQQVSCLVFTLSYPRPETYSSSLVYFPTCAATRTWELLQIKASKCLVCRANEQTWLKYFFIILLMINHYFQVLYKHMAVNGDFDDLWPRYFRFSKLVAQWTILGHGCWKRSLGKFR